MHFKLISVALSLAIVGLVVAVPTLASISNKEPVRVTYKNSGPKYEFDDVDKQPIGPNEVPPFMKHIPASPSKKLDEQPPTPLTSSNPTSSADNNEEDDTLTRQIPIRRIFVVPIRHTISSPDDNDSQDDMAQALFPRFPLMPSQLHSHLFGRDQASRSPFSTDSDDTMMSSTSNNKNQHELQHPAMIDPAVIMMDLLNRMLTSSAMRPSESPFGRHPENKDESSTESADSKPNEGSGDDKIGAEASSIGAPVEKPVITNENKSEIVDIDGQKYIRKTIIQKHVGPGIFFVTKRLIFSPANETEVDSPAIGSTTTTTTTTTTTVAPKLELSSTTTQASDIEAKREEVESSEAPKVSSLEKEGDSSIPSTPREIQPKVTEKLIVTSESSVDNVSPSATTSTTTTTEKPKTN